jgi:hypothetical protein
MKTNKSVIFISISAFSILSAIGLGLYGMERDSGLFMLFSGIAMALSLGFSIGALVKQRAAKKAADKAAKAGVAQ